MTDFEKIKQFFIEHIDKFVYYKIISKDEKINSNYLPDYVLNNLVHNESVKDFFVMEFPSINENKSLVTIDSCDSFVFDIYFVDYGDKIVLTDAGRTFDCCVEAPEGNGVFANQKDVMTKYLNKFGIINNFYTIEKQITFDTYIKDTINFVKALQTINHSEPYPPYVLELDNAKETVDVLSRTWIKGEKITDGKDSRSLALFDNHKNLCENQTCPQNGYCEYNNKHAFVGIFFNDDNKVLITRRLKASKPQYDFTIKDYVIENESYSLEALQRAVHDNFGTELWFGEVAPILTTLKNKVITDYYIINSYNISIDDLSFDSKEVAYGWATIEEIIVLIKSGDFGDYTETFISYVCELKSSI